MVDAEGEGRMTLVPPSRGQVQQRVADWELFEPAVAPVMARRPDGEPAVNPEAAYDRAAVARRS
ncbi:hypothetical protein GCM10009665_27210 [Kitasatospora nipponensis]|uniref:Uncharacterized protein n=1 Tax=Kitasatospora nipponensis TaxID=258049 RepID=A0ABN1W4Q3_9ACTN